MYYTAMISRVLVYTVTQDRYHQPLVWALSFFMGIRSLGSCPLARPNMDPVPDPEPSSGSFAVLGQANQCPWAKMDHWLCCPPRASGNISCQVRKIYRIGSGTTYRTLIPSLGYKALLIGMKLQDQGPKSKSCRKSCRILCGKNSPLGPFVTSSCLVS